MYINVGEGNKCWLVCLVDPELDIYNSTIILKRFSEKSDALTYAYRLTKLPVCVGTNPSSERQ